MFFNKDKNEEFAITNIEDANNAMLIIGNLRNQVKQNELKIENKIAEIRKQYDVSEEMQKIANLEEKLSAFMCLQDEKIFNSTKTINLLNGRLMKRISPAKCECIEGLSWNDVMERIKVNGISNCIRTIEKLDKTAIKKLSKEQMNIIGVALNRSINYKFELK